MENCIKIPRANYVDLNFELSLKNFNFLIETVHFYRRKYVWSSLNADFKTDKKGHSVPS